MRRSFAIDLALAFAILTVLQVTGALTCWGDGQPLYAITWFARLAVAIIAIRWVIYEVRPAWSDKTLG